MHDIAFALKQLDNKIKILAQGRCIQLIAVSKTKPAEMIQKALDAGQRMFGENQVQEAQAKWPALKQQYSDIELHLIGPLQTNKVRKALQLFDVIEVLDRFKLAHAIARISKEEQKYPKIYIQVNIGKEPQKAGITPDELKDFYAYCQNEEKLNIAGLMAIPPHGQDPMPYFQQLKQLQMMLDAKDLSMGMSGDYDKAIICGATHIRIGSHIFGARS